MSQREASVNLRKTQLEVERLDASETEGFVTPGHKPAQSRDRVCSIMVAQAVDFNTELMDAEKGDSRTWQEVGNAAAVTSERDD